MNCWTIKEIFRHKTPSTLTCRDMAREQEVADYNHMDVWLPFCETLSSHFLGRPVLSSERPGKGRRFNVQKKKKKLRAGIRRNSFPALFSPVFLNPLHICYTHVSCKPPWHREERPLSQPPFSTPCSPSRADCRNYQNIWGEKKKREEEEGAEIPWCCSINHKHSRSSKSPASIRDLGPSSKPPSASPTQRPPPCSQRLSQPLQNPKLPSSPAPFAPTSLSPAHKLRAPSLPLYVLLTAPGHRDFSSAGATFTLAPGSVLPLNHNTAIQHMHPSQSSSLMLQTTEKNFSIAPQKGRNERPGNCSCALGEQESWRAYSCQPQSP